MKISLSFITQLLQAIPATVMGIEQIAGEAPGADKKTLALQSLGLAEGVAEFVAPQFKPVIDAATMLAGGAIDSTVALFNAIQHPTFTAPAPTPIAVVQTTAAAPAAPGPTSAATAATPAPGGSVSVGGFQQ